MNTRGLLRDLSGWAIAAGIVMMILGLIAIAAPIFTSVAAEIVLGVLFLLGGIAQLVHALQHDQSDRSFWVQVILSLLYGLVGILLLANPFSGVVSLTLFVGIFFFIDGAFRVVLAFRERPKPRWGWILLNGLLMIILGILIWSHWPLNAAWIFGSLVGLGLVCSGLSMILFGTANRSIYEP